jgi:hypothetical protein
MAITLDQNTQIARELNIIGLNEQAGAGLVNQRLAELHATNPEIVDAYEARRKQIDPEFSAQNIRDVIAGAPGASFEPAPAQITPEFSAQENQRILESFGFTGQVGDGSGNEFLRNNAQFIDQFEEARQRFDPNFSADNIRSTIPQGTNITDQLGGQVLTPNLPAGTEINPTLQTVQSDELLGSGAFNLDTGSLNINLPAPVTSTDVGTGAASAVTAPTIQGTQTTAVDPLVAAQGAVSNDAKISTQLANLFADFTTGKVPSWALDAHNAATDEMAARGLGSSTIAAGALAAAHLKSAVPIAAAEADKFFQMDMANLNNRQTAAMENFKARQQNMLTDVSIANATEQMNAQNSIQVQEFVASLVTQIDTQNADRRATIDQFNVSTEVAVNEFNSNLKNQREQFNASMGYAVAQSNALWKRSVNTANTAAVNAANATNAQNLLNISQTAQQNLWLKTRDEENWIFQAGEAQKNRDYNLAMALGNRDFISSLNDPNLGELLGRLGVSLFLDD